MDIKKWNEIPGSRAVENWPYTNLHDLNLDWIINTTKEFAAEISRFEDNVASEVSDFENSVTVKIGDFEGTMQEYTARMDTALATVDEKIAYIDNFFSSLDVQQEINNKLDSMSADGSLAALLKPFADAYMQQDAPGIITAWLTANITEPEGVVIDSSLSVSGAAADAKVTGDIRSAAGLDLQALGGAADSLFGNAQTLTATATPYQYTNIEYPLKAGKRYKVSFKRSVPATSNVLIGSANNFTYVDEFIARILPGFSSIDFVYTPSADAANFRVEFSETASNITYTLVVSEEIPNKSNIRTMSGLSGTPRYGFMQRGIYSGEESGYYQTMWYDVEGLYSVNIDMDTSYYHDIYAILDEQQRTISYLTSDANSHYSDTVQLPANAKYLVVSANSETKLSNAVIKAPVRNESTNLVGKKIVWYGTSVPAAGKDGYGNYNTYPLRLGALLGANVYNESIGSSPVHCRRTDYVSADNPYGFIEPFDAVSRCLSNSIAMMDWIIDHYTMFRGAPATLTDADKAFIRSCSYESRINKYLTSDNSPDIWVFDHGINDYMGSEEQYSESDPYNTFTFQGGYNFLINLIKQYNPKAQIILISNYEDQRNPNIAKYQNKVAARWNFPIVKMYEMLGWNDHNVITSAFWRDGLWETKGGVEHTMSYINVWCADDLHPHSDKSGKALDYYTRSLFQYFKNVTCGDYFKV